MDMQNVSNLQIPEGAVRTIHDKDNRLIWGRLAYDTRYAGNTIQDGTPAPDAPIAIQTVTDEQTITISDSIDSDAFPVSLGGIELYKTGEYQDYIYKSGSDWYLHKGIGSHTFNGTEHWSAAAVGGEYVFYTTVITDYATQNNVPISEFFRGVSNVTSYSGTPRNSIAFINISGQTTPRFYVRYASNFSSANEIGAFMSANKPTVYYALATPTDTKITDTILIGQLNAAHEWLTRYGYNATVTGNLPIVISKTNL